MDWKDLFRRHLTMIGDLWVGAEDVRHTVLAADEQKRLLNKMQTLHDQQAEIEHACVRALRVRAGYEREDQVIDYDLHMQWLVRQQKTFYVEERCEHRQAVIRGGDLIADAPLSCEKGQEAVPEAGGDNRHEPESLRARNYDRMQAVRYADLWWNRRNPQYPQVSDDCTNYISQCLHAGGIVMWGAPVRGRGWWQNRTNWSFSWTVADSLRRYLGVPDGVIGAVEKSSARELVPGDVICYDFEGDGRWNHNTIVTELDGAGQPLVNAHTYDARHRPWPYTDSPAWTKNIKYKFFHIKDQV